jgi:hypothetical protein
MENRTLHAYMEDIHRLNAGGCIPWPAAHLFFRRSPEFGRPNLMIASAVPLANYEPLTDGELLCDGRRDSGFRPHSTRSYKAAGD